MAQRLAFILNSEGVLIENPVLAGNPVPVIHGIQGEERNGWWHRATDRGDAIAASIDWKFGVPPIGTTPMPAVTTTFPIPKGERRERGKDGTITKVTYPDRHDGWRAVVNQPIILGDSPGISANVPNVPRRSIGVVGP